MSFIRSRFLKYFLAGLAVDAALVLLVAAYAVADTAAAYEGRCGGGFIFGGAPRACTRSEYVSEMLPWLLLVPLYFWPYVLAALVLPPLAGLLLAWRKGRRAR
jgi:hypothetical protein